jgi:hypothetical protein
MATVVISFGKVRGKNVLHPLMIMHQPDDLSGS